MFLIHVFYSYILWRNIQFAKIVTFFILKEYLKVQILPSRRELSSQISKENVRLFVPKELTFNVP